MNFLRSFGGSNSTSASKAEAGPESESKDGLAGLEVSGAGGDEGPPQAQASDSDRQSLWKTLSSKLGGDVSVGISLPASFFEPTTTLQRMAEMLHFSELLDSAAEKASPIDRLIMVSVFACTNYNSTERFYKPFNPVLGESFEFVDEAKGVHLVAEQVSHHPPVSAQHCEGKHWVFWQDGRPTTRFNGNSIDIFPHSKTHIYIPRSRDHFVFQEIPTTRINNLIIGRSWIEHYGEFRILNRKTGDHAVLTFEKSSWAPWRSTKHVVKGEVKNSKGKTVAKITGRWSGAIEVEWVADFPKMCESVGTKKEMWRQPANNKNGKYDWTEFTSRLNVMTTDEKELQGVSYEELLPRTDSRLRPDRLAIEHDGPASTLKNVIEERQRSDRKARAAKGEFWTPKWFHCIEDKEGLGGRAAKGEAAAADDGDDAEPNSDGEVVVDEEKIWVYCGNYWEQREQRLQWMTDKHAEEAEAHSDEGHKSQHDGSSSDEVARDEDEGTTTEPLGVLDLVGLACDFRSYKED